MGITDPDPLYHPDGLTMFDPHPAISDYNDPIPPGLARVTGNLLRAIMGNCDAFCEVRLSCVTPYNTTSFGCYSLSLAIVVLPMGFM